ncbi:hypothetical protein [Stenotrophomonas geniculata]|uniref:hypothetical protein n=1 Tax=Stenotrophomonas geniculata TaxID=86188 RepID=UPI002E75DD4F|nr:hypothetical protein [Stenotrophomonas geniculata]
MSKEKTTLADVQPGGRVRLGDRPKDGEVLVKVLGLTGSGKSAIAGEIEILCKALGLEVEWVNGDEEKRLTHADWIGALEMYKPKAVIVEQNIPRAAHSAQPSPGGQNALDCIGRIEEAIEFRVPHDIYAAVHGELAELKAALASRQSVGEPEIWVSPGQLEELKRRPAGQGSNYLPTRLASEGNFTQPLYAAPPAQAVDLGDFKALYRAYVRLLESGRDRIRDLGGTCDLVDVMEANDVDLQAARRVIDSKAVGNG